MVVGYCARLRWRVVYLLVEGFSVDDIARILHVGKTFVKKIREIYRNTSTVDDPPRGSRAREMDGMCHIRRK